MAMLFRSSHPTTFLPGLLACALLAATGCGSESNTQPPGVQADASNGSSGASSAGSGESSGMVAGGSGMSASGSVVVGSGSSGSAIGSGTSSGSSSGMGSDDASTPAPDGSVTEASTPITTLDSWPQAGGPDGTFRVNVEGAPTTWSVAANKTIVWAQNLPNEGQGGIAVAGNFLFLTTFPAGATGNGIDVVGYAIDRTTGMIKWQTPMNGPGFLHGNGEASPIAYQYSDATSWTPITDGTYVWFFNSAGHIDCYDMSGTLKWERTFAGQSAVYPYNRQHEPFMVGTNIVILSPLDPMYGDPAPKVAGWNYLHGIDKMTGKTTWVAQDASTFYNTAVMGKLSDGTLGVVHGRGGPHGVPETPVGLSLTSLAPGKEGTSLWQYNSGGAPVCTGGSATMPQMCTGGSGTALYTMSWDSKYAYWFTTPPGETLNVLDIGTGKQVHGWSLAKPADVRRWDKTTSKYASLSAININNTADWSYPYQTMHVVPDWHSNIVANGYVWFLAVANNNDRWGTHTGPPHCLGRVDVETGKVEYLEVPVGVRRAANMPDQPIYGMDITTTPVDYKGTDVASDGRSRTDGWSIPAFYASPILLGTKLYFGTTVGITYVIDATAKVLDETAILGLGDLGLPGQTWSLAGPSFAGGILYHHSSKQVVAIHP
jgi:hypothetical protein